MIELFTADTPNGKKISIMLEEIGYDYKVTKVDISKDEQFKPEFIKLSPFSKIPVITDHDNQESIFESGAILLYLAEKFGEFIPKNPTERTECLSWLFWQMGSAPYLGGGFGHFYSYAPEKIKYAIDRFAMEAKRQLDVLDQRLAQVQFVSGSSYSIADIAIWPWYGQLVLGRLYKAGEFLDVTSYKYVLAWAEKINERSAVQRGRMVNRTSGDPSSQLLERHDASDFELHKKQF